MRKTDSESKRRERSEKRSGCALGEVGLRLSREGLKEPVGSHETVKEKKLEIAAHF